MLYISIHDKKIRMKCEKCFNNIPISHFHTHAIFFFKLLTHLQFFKNDAINTHHNVLHFYIQVLRKIRMKCGKCFNSIPIPQEVIFVTENHYMIILAIFYNLFIPLQGQKHIVCIELIIQMQRINSTPINRLFTPETIRQQ